MTPGLRQAPVSGIRSRWEGTGVGFPFSFCACFSERCCANFFVMASFIERLVSPTPDVCLYGLAPPKRSTDPAKLRAILQAQMLRLQTLGPDALIVYDLQDEAVRQPDKARPFPFLPTVPPAVYAYDMLGALEVPKIVYRCVAQDTKESLSRWLESPAPNAAGSAPRLSVLVGAPSSSVGAHGLSLNEAYGVARTHADDCWIGGIAIAERHARRGDEHERLLQKIAAGCRFFVTQAVYDAGATKSLLSDYARALRQSGQRPVPVILTFSPCGSLKTLELMKWLGIAFPRWLENELLDAHDVLQTSLRLCIDTWKEVLAFAREKNLPLGLNVESISIRREEVEASAVLFSALREHLRATP